MRPETALGIIPNEHEGARNGAILLTMMGVLFSFAMWHVCSSQQTAAQQKVILLLWQIFGLIIFEFGYFYGIIAKGRYAFMATEKYISSEEKLSDIRKTAYVEKKKQNVWSLVCLSCLVLFLVLDLQGYYLWVWLFLGILLGKFTLSIKEAAWLDQRFRWAECERKPCTVFLQRCRSEISEPLYLAFSLYEEPETVEDGKKAILCWIGMVNAFLKNKKLQSQSKALRYVVAGVFDCWEDNFQELRELQRRLGIK